MSNIYLDTLNVILRQKDLTRDVIGQAAIAQAIENLAEAVANLDVEDDNDDDFI